MKNFSLAGIVLSIFVFLIPFTSTKTLFYGSLNAKYFLIMGFSALFTLYFSYLVFRNRFKFNVKKRYLLIILLIVLVINYLASFTGVFPERSLWSDILRSTGVYFLTALTLISIFSAQLLNRFDWVLVRRSIAVSAAIFAFLTYFARKGLALKFKFASVNLETPGLAFGNSTFAGSFLLLALIITLIEVVRATKGSRARKVFATLAIIQFTSPLFINWQAIFSNFSYVLENPFTIIGNAQASGITAFLVMGYVFVLFVLPKFFKSVPKNLSLKWTGVLVVIVFGMIALLFTPGSFVQDKFVETTTAARFVIWDIGIEAFKDRPLLGWGPENFRLGFEQNFNNRLHLEGRITEVWMDRAHNVFVGTLVSVGIIGFLATAALLVYLTSVFLRAYKKGLIAEKETGLLILFIAAHLLQLQTSFNTPGAYVLFTVFIAYGLWLELQMVDSSVNNKLVGKFIAGLLIVLVLFGGYHTIGKEYYRQRNLVNAFKTTDNSEQMQFIEKALTGKRDFEALRLSSDSLINGTFRALEGKQPEIVQSIVQKTMLQLDLYEKYYKDYLEITPNDYRINMNYVRILLTRTVFGDNRLEEAKQIVDISYDLSPTNPLTYTMDSVIALYGGNVKEARERIAAGLELGPDVLLTKATAAYIEDQIKRAPNIRPLKLENL